MLDRVLAETVREKHETFLSTRMFNGQEETGMMLAYCSVRKPEFDKNHFEFPDMDNPDCKANFML